MLLEQILILVLFISVLSFVYPYLIYPYILKLFRKDSLSPTLNKIDTKLSVSLLFCAYNEEVALPEKIKNIRELKKLRPDLEILAYSDCSDDDTNMLLNNARDILKPVIGKIRRGKVAGMQQLVSMVNSDVIVFTDANVILEPSSLTKLVDYFLDPRIGCVAGTLHYVTDVESDISSTEMVGGLYWKLEEKIKWLETQSGSTMGADGAIFARRGSIEYPLLPSELVDDLAVSMSVIFSGYRCITAKDVIAYEKSVSQSAEEFKRKRRIACGSYATYKYLYPNLRKMSWINQFKFFSHKIIRWWGFIFLMVGVAASFVLGWLSGFPLASSVIATTIILILWIAGKWRIGVFSTMYEVLIAIVATGLGVIEYYSGRQYSTWSPAKSR